MGMPLLIGIVLMGVLSRSGGPGLNLVGMLMNRTIFPLLHLGLTDRAYSLVSTTMGRFGSYLLW
jgi:hypothetical protein